MLARTRKKRAPVLKALYLSMKKVILSAFVFVPILVVLAAYLYGAPTCSINAFELKTKSDISVVGKAIELYRQDKGSLPKNLGQLVGEYLEEPIKMDPWGEDYKYISNENEFILFSYGNPEKNELIYHVQRKKI